RDQAIANQIAVEAGQLTATDSSLVAQLDIAANHFSPTPDSETRLLDTITTPLYGRLTSPAGDVRSMAFSPDGKTLAAGGNDHRAGRDDQVWLWDLADPTRPVRLGQPLTGAAGFVDAVAFSPDGKTLAAASWDGKVWLWNLTDPVHPVQF